MPYRLTAEGPRVAHARLAYKALRAPTC